MIRKTMTLLTLASLLASCGPDFAVPGAKKNPSAGGAATDLSKLSQFGKATASDITVGPDGTIHAVFIEEHTTHHRQQLFYRASTDDGATWSDPENLSDFEREDSVGTINIEVDGEGRVYAVGWYAAGNSWSGAYANFGNSDLHNGTLVYRVLDGAGWSDPVIIGEQDQSYSWFTSVDPTGKVHVLWVENMVPEETLPSASRIVQSSLEGASLGERQVRWEPKGTQQYGMTYLDRYQDLRGYVDAEGLPHWIASRRTAADTSGARTFIYSNGEKETELFLESRFGGANFLIYPPNLIVDANGGEHIITLDLGADKPAVIDIPLAKGARPTVVRETASADGTVMTFQAVAGPEGRAMAFVGLTESRDLSDDADLHLVTFDGVKWGKSVNLTGNGARAKASSTQTGLGSSISTSSVFLPRYGAGAFGPDGTSHLLIVNDEKGTFSSDRAAGLVSYGGSVTESNVFYLQP
jgi:hypothetical protein